MSAWEVTADDINLVLQKHDQPQALDVAESILVEESDRIEKAALWYDSDEDQAASALDEIETILIENDILKGPKLFAAP